MPFDFDTPIDRRGTFSEKWDRYSTADVIPLWVADMDFPAPPAVLQALRERIDHGIFGYTAVPQPLVEAFCQHVHANYGWQISPDWLVFIPGLVCGLNITCAAIGQAGDSVLTAARSICRSSRPRGTAVGRYCAYRWRALLTDGTSTSTHSSGRSVRTHGSFCCAILTTPSAAASTGTS